MLRSGILNPALNELLSRFRHTNCIVIADRAFPFWPQVPTIDLALVDGIPTVGDVLRALTPRVLVGHAWMASEFRQANSEEIVSRFRALVPSVSFEEKHVDFKRRVPAAIGLIRTADTIPYANIILESA